MISSSQLREFARYVYGYYSKGQALEADLFKAEPSISVRRLFAVVRRPGRTSSRGVPRNGNVANPSVACATPNDALKLTFRQYL